MAKQQKATFKIPSDLTDSQKELLGEEILEHIKTRTESGTGARPRGRGYQLYDFPGYSKSYRTSLEFKIAGKSASNVDLTLSGDMLAAMEVLAISRNRIEVGYRSGTEENARAEGNQLGSYGRSPNPKKARHFLGLTKDELEMLIERVRNA